MKKTLSLVLVVVFLLLCLLPSVGMLILGASEAGANEVLSAKPKLLRRDGKVNAAYLTDCADYINDRFALRQECITLWARLNASLFHTSVTDSVLLGDDGWLYYAPTLDDYTGSAPMTERELFCAAETLSLVQEYVEAHGGSFLFVCAPNKSSLYPEHMPSRPVLSGRKNLDALNEKLSALGVHTLDLRPAFLASPETLYFRTDSHWNGRGAALAADGILSALDRDSALLEATTAPSSHRGDLYEMLYPAGRGTEADHTYAPGFSFTADTDNADSITIKTTGSGDGALLCYRDSFGRNLYPFLAESFGEATFSRKADYDPTALPEGGAMVIELVERNLRYLRTNAPTLPAPLRAEPDTDEVGAPIPVKAGKCPLDGYFKLTGALDGVMPDALSPVYVTFAGACYEAVPQSDGFSLCLPGDAADFTEAEIIASVGGVWTRFPVAQ